MSLLAQLASLCAASLGLGVAWLLVQGEPSTVPAGGEQAVCAPPAPAEVLETPWIEQSEAHALYGDPNVVFVDCRPAEEFVLGHIAHALSLPSDRPEIEAEHEAVLRPARTIIAYCDTAGGCASSARLSARLRELGMRDVRILRGGLPGWIERGYPAESGTCPLCPKEGL